jgi:anti-sigma B factor antagonist
MPCQGCAALHPTTATACPLALPAPAQPATPRASRATAQEVAAPALAIEAQRHGSYSQVALGGELDLATSCSLHFGLQEELEHCPHVVVEVTALTFTDAVGLRILHDAATEASARGGGLVLAGANPRLDRLLHIARLPLLLPIYHDVHEAARASRG